MTPCRVAPGAAGELLLESPEGGRRTVVLFDPQVFAPKTEEIKLEDGRLRGAWGERVFRILLSAENPPRQGAWTVRIAQR